MSGVAGLISLAVFLQTVEMLWISIRLRQIDPWAEVSFGPLDYLYPFVLVLGLVAAALALFWPTPLAFAVMLLLTWAVAVRFRGSFNGSSDGMTFHVLAAVTLWKFWPDTEFLSLAYVAIQACLSYFMAGFSKAKQMDWWTGQALAVFLTSSNAASPQSQELAMKISRVPSLYRVISIAAVAFDLLFPLGLLVPQTLFVFLPLGLIFHLINFRLFGLNRFVWTWLATYPAIYLFAHHLHQA